MMKRSYLYISIAAMATSTTLGFAPFVTPHRHALHTELHVSNPSMALPEASQDEELPYFVSLKPRPPQTAPPVEATNKKSVPSPKPKHGGDGVFAPVVKFTKSVLGDDRLNKIRAKVISLHADTIGSFVDTADTATGKAALKLLFDAADKNRNGLVEEDELAEALRALGFEWLQEKQVQGIFKRADLDANGRIDFEEFMKEAPKTLRTNLIKLAKTNGGKMGLLA